MGITTELAAYCAGLTLAQLPPEVVDRAHLLVLDLVGNIVRGRHDAESSPALLEAAQALGLCHGDCHVFGDDGRYSAAGAALLNGAFAHSLDFDDTHAAGSLHPGAPVIPAALAAAEMCGASGADVLAAIVAGYEVTCRVALALPAGAHYDRGFHPTATCGAFGAAVAAARVFGLDSEGVENALGIALSQSAGSLQFLANGAWTKRFQVGWAAMAGLTAASLAQKGFKGASEALEGRLGFLRAYAPEPNPARVTQDLGTVFELMATAVKPYPSCRYGHAGIDAVLGLRAELGLRPEEIESITYGLSHAGLLLVGIPAKKRANPVNIVDGQFSGPFVLSCALVTGAMGWESYASLSDPVVRAMLPKVHCVHDADMQAEYPTNMSGRITIRARGQEFVRTVIVPKGEPGNFLSDSALREKFMGLTQAILGAGTAALLAETVLALSDLATIAPLMARSQPAVAPASAVA